MTDDQPIVRLALVDDHQVFASSVGVALGAEPDIDVVGTAHDLASADRMLRESDPQVVLLDHRLPDGDGVTALPQLRKAAPEASFVVLTASTAEQVLVSAIENGAAGFVSKTRSLGELTSAVRAAAAGEAVISPELLARLLPRMNRTAERKGAYDLTARELEVLELLAEGTPNHELGARMGISRNTVRNHVQNLLTKLGVHSRLEAVALATREGLVRPHAAVDRERTVGGGEPAAQRGGDDGRELRGEPHEVRVRVVQRDDLGERAPVREPGLLLVRAHLLLTRRADVARPARADERHGHPVARAPARHRRSHRDDLAGQLVPRHMRQRDGLVVPLPRVPVAAAHAGGGDAQHHAVGRAVGVGHPPDLRRGTELVDHQSTHDPDAPRPAAASPRRGPR